MVDALKLDWSVTVPPAVEPIDILELRSPTTGSYLRVDFTDDDLVLTALIKSCRTIAEQICSLAFAPQTIQAIWTMPQVNAGSLSGFKLLYDQDFYQYNESLGANPFSPAPFVLQLPQPPLVVDTLPSPGLVYLQYPPPAYQYRLTYTCGYATLPPDLKLALQQFIAWKYENRTGEEMPAEIQSQFMGNKVWVL